MTLDLPSPQSDCTSSTAPLPYTSSPFALLWSDIKLFCYHALAVPGIVLPLKPWSSGPLDELYPSLANLYAITLHVFLIFAQLLVLISIPICLFFPIPLGLFVLYAAIIYMFNYFFCFFLNGKHPTLQSRVKLDCHRFFDRHEGEQWIFVNGVAVGHHWLQSNLDRLSITFGRKILGIHNPTKGIIFDVLECLIQRDFGYNTMAVRNCYVEVKKAILDKKFNKIVLILHSQGGIEGGHILDWLLADVPNGFLNRLEVYTFGCAANHFNNPLRSRIDTQSLSSCPTSEKKNKPGKRVIRCIEHYGNSGDFVSKWGVLNFAASEIYKGNRYVGQLFKRDGSGHQMNQHYLDNMFPMETPNGPVQETNDFMDQLVNADIDSTPTRESDSVNAVSQKVLNQPNGSSVADVPNGALDIDSVAEDGEAPEVNATRLQKKPIRELSRLWQYRNGRSPKD